MSARPRADADAIVTVLRGGDRRCRLPLTSRAARCCAAPPWGRLRWPSPARGGRRRQASRPISFSSWPTISAMPMSPATAAPISARPTSIASPRRACGCSQAYANSAVCSATRTALITGRYQYRLRLGLEEPLAGNPDVGLPPEHPTLPSLLKQAGYGTTLIGKWHLGALPKFGPLQSGYDHFYGFRGGAVDYYAHSGTNQQADLWDDDMPVQQAGYITELLRQPRGRRGQRLCQIGRAFPHQPAFQRAALALGGAGRRGGIRARAARQSARLRRRHAAHLSPHDRGDGSADRPRAGDAGLRPGSPRTPSSSSPATMAASASPIPGRSRAGRLSCSKAACAFPR